MFSRFRSHSPLVLPRKALLAAAIGLALSACGGSEQAEDLARTWQQIQSQHQISVWNGQNQPMPGANPPPGTATPAPLQNWPLGTKADASRFLAQATFGASLKDIDALTGQTANIWLERQFAKPQTSLLHTLDLWTKQDKKKAPTITDFQNVWWYSTLQDDQLRQRMAYSLSQIFVISSNGSPGQYPRGMAHYYDMLGKHAFGNFRQLLEDVSLHPMMGLYLTHMRNQKTTYNSAGVRVRAPDENYAREVMQLFSIGLEQLNPDGTPKRDASGKPIPTYSNDDIVGLAKVFTGWSWSGPRRSLDCFNGWHASCNQESNPGRDTRLMVAYPEYHSIQEKRFLGVTIPHGNARPEEDLKIALDTLFNHPNVGPFIGRQLIQRLVVSNPSPAYVSRVAAAFNNNGNGVRGDMKAVIRAILLDPEARSAEAAQRIDGGRIREPLLRLTNWMRAFNVDSVSNRWNIGRTDTSRLLNQTALRSPSVFNFYRPGYTPANTPVSNAGLVAPEMQIIHESSVADYAYFSAIFTGGYSHTAYGIGPFQKVPDPDKPGTTINRRDVRTAYRHEITLARQPEKLVDHINLVLLSGQMRPSTRSSIIRALEGINYPKNGDPVVTAHINTIRVGTAVYLAMLSTDYLLLK